MVDRQLNKFAMYQVVMHNLMNNKNLWEELPYFVTNVNALSALIVAIRKANKVKMTNRTGFTQMKTNSRADLELSAMTVVNIMRSFAKKIDNKVLQEQVHFTPSMLKICDGSKLITDTEAIHVIATNNFTAASTYGLKQEFLDDLKAKNLNFLADINLPADAYLLRKDANTSLKQLFEEGDELLKENIDRDIKIFKDDESLFCDAHTICRKIVGSPVIKLAMRIKIVDAATKQPMPQVQVVIKDHDIKRKSSPKGALRIHHLKEGKHIVYVSMKGYVSQDVLTIYNAGKTTSITVDMRREEGEE